MGKRGPKPKSPKQRRLDATARKHPGSADDQGEVIAFTSGLPAAPRHLDRRGKALFRELARELHRAGVLRKVDAPTLAEYCQAVSDAERLTVAIRKTGGEVLPSSRGGQRHNALASHLKTARAAILRFGSRLGLSPRDRQAIRTPAKDVPDEPEHDDMAAFELPDVR